ncbi:MAG TPA: glyoxylate/hydroxypyruvate reductase A [Xanthomonadaceae bacterium]|nr:glyoxylate/hydroxypyruvate reductase A [Xanthomonadaceae bacterium]
MTLLYKSDPQRGQIWARIFTERMPELRLRFWPDTGEAAQVRYLAAWEPPPDLSIFPNLEIVFGVGAGIDHLDLTALPPGVRVVRMIEPGIREGMLEYVSAGVLALHRELPQYLRQQRERRWQPLPAVPAARRRVGVLGIGELGGAVLRHLRDYGFDCAGWSRSPRKLEGIASFAGPAGLDALLARSDILACLLPLTEATRGLLDASLFARLPRGAALLQVGRGAQLVAADLLAALDSGQLGEAILDVTDPEPLPPDDPLWRHPRLWLTPHIASTTRAEGSALALLENLRRHRAGAPLLGEVERARGY